MFHRHQWTTTGERFNPRDRRVTNIKGADQWTLLATLYGITVITQQCDKCGRVKVDKELGHTKGAV